MNLLMKLLVHLLKFIKLWGEDYWKVFIINVSKKS